MERGELPSRSTVGRLLGRALAIGVAGFAVYGAATFFVAFAGRHDDSSNLVPFGGWQVDVAAAGVALISAALVGAAILAMRRYRLAPATPRSYQVLAASIAIILGAAAAQAFRHQPERAYNWAAGHTGGAKQERAQDAAVELQMLGDATHPPMPFGPDGVSPFRPAPRSVAALLLRPTDLGIDWYSEGQPRGSTTAPTNNIYGISGLVAVGHQMLAQEIWNGAAWVQKIAVSDVARRFVSAAAARRFLATQLAELRTDLPTTTHLDRSDIGRVTIWEESFTGAFRDHIVYAAVGPVALDLHVTPVLRNEGNEGGLPYGPTPAFPEITARQIIRATIDRIQKAASSK